MPKYVMRDATGQLWHDIDDSNLQEFMRAYPAAEIVEEIQDDDVLQDQQVTEQVEATEPPPTQEDTLKKELNKFDNSQKTNQNLFDTAFKSIEQRDEFVNSLNEEDKKAVEEKRYNDLSKQALGSMAKFTMGEAAGSLIKGSIPALLKGDFAAAWESSPLGGVLTGLGKINKLAQFELDEYSADEPGKYQQDLNNYLETRDKEKIPTDFLDTKLGGSLVGNEEAEVVPSLKKLYGDYGFDFVPSGRFTDNVIVRTKDGTKELEIKLDNWTDSGDREEAAKLKKFLDENQGEYKPVTNMDQYVLDLANKNHLDLNEKAKMKQDDWAITKLDRGISQEKVDRFDNDYNEDIINYQTQSVNNQIIKLNKEQAKLQAEQNTLAQQAARIRQQVAAGTLSQNNAEAQLKELEAQEQVLRDKASAFTKDAEQTMALRGALDVIAGKKFVVDATKGDIGSHTVNILGDMLDNFNNFGNVVSLSLEELTLDAKGVDPVEAQKKIQERFEQIDTEIKPAEGVTDEYAQEFDSTITGGLYRSVAEMLTMMGASALTGPAAPFVYGGMMGLNVAGGVVEEMNEMEDVSNLEKLGMASSIGVVNGVLESVGAKYTKVFAPGGLTGVTKKVMLDSFKRLAGKEVTKKALKETAEQVLKEGLEKGIYRATTRGFVEGAVGEGLTEVSQTISEVGIKSLYNELKDDEKFKELSKQLTVSNLLKTFTIGGLAGGMFGGLSATSSAYKTRTMDRITNRQFLFAKALTTNPSIATQYSAYLSSMVADPKNKMTKEAAEAELRSLREAGGIYKQVSDLGLTTEGEKRAFTLLQKKANLQKQIDAQQDKALVKRQREEITTIDKQLEDISLTYNFEAAYQRGIEKSAAIAEASGKGFNIIESSSDFEAKMKEFGEQDDDGFRSTPGYIDSEGNIYINDEAARNFKQIGVANHELLHGITGKQLAGISADEKAALIEDFKSNLSKKELDVITPRINKQYGGAKGITAEEYFNVFAEAIIDGDIKYNENIFTKIGDWLTKNILRPLGFAQASFKDGKAVYRFMKDYGKQSRRIVMGAQEDFEGDVATIVEEGTATPAIPAMSRRDVTELAKSYKEDPGSADVEQLIQQYRNLAFKALGYERGKGDIPASEAQSFVDAEFVNIIDRYDGSTEFSTWVNSNIRPKRQQFYQEQIGETAESLDKQEARQVADEAPTRREVSEKEARQETRKIKVAKRLGVEEQIKKEVDSKIKDIDVTKLNYKKLKNLATDTVGELFGISPKKLISNANLTKGEIANAQRFIAKNVDLLMSMLPEGYSSDFTSSGVPKVLLENFYNQRSVRAKTGPGLKVQIKKPDIKTNDFLEVFGFVDGKPTRDDRNISSRIIALANQTGKMMTNQAVREKAIKDGVDAVKLKALSSPVPQGFFSRTAKNLDLDTQMVLVDLLTSDELLSSAEDLRRQGKSNWLSEALVGNASPEFRKTYSLPPAILRTIGNELQQEFDPKKSWQEYIKKATDIQIDEAKIGIYSTLRQIARARGFEIDTGTGAYSDLSKLNQLRLEISNLLQDLKEEGVSDSDISKFILPALVGSYKMGRFKLNNNRVAPSAILNDADVFIDQGTPRQGIYGSSTDANANADVNSTDRLSGQIHQHKSWYIKPLSRVQQKKYGVKNFDDLPLSKRSSFIKNEIQPEGLKAKEVLDKVTKLMAKLVKENKLSPQTAGVFIDLQFARMDGLGKLASDVRFIPTDTRSDIIKIFDLSKSDDFVLEHTIPGNRVKLAMYNAVLGGDKNSMDLFESELEQYHSAIIPKAFDKLVNRKDGKELYLRTTPAIRQAGDFALSETGRYADTSRFPMSLYDVTTKKTYGEPQELQQPVEESRQSNNDLGLSSKVISNVNVNGFFSKTNADEILNFETTDKAINNGNKVEQPVKKIRVFDFDDTLATSKNLVFADKGDERLELNAEEFAAEGDRLLNEGYKFDFTDFNTVRDGGRGPLFELAKRIKEARGNEDLYVLTARAPEAQTAIYEFLKSQGLEFKKQNIVGLGDSTGAAKAQWMISKYAEGYNDFYFADDAYQNVYAVQQAFDVLDVKGRVQQAKAEQGFRSTRDINEEFNKIIEQTKGIDAGTKFSDVRAKLAGQKNDKFKFWIPYSAEDLTGLIYPLLGKGKVGDAQMKFFKEMLFSPLARANAGISSSRIQMMNDFQALKKELKVPKNLTKENKTGFTNEQVVRIYIWNKLGQDIPGISSKELNDALAYVEDNIFFKDKLKTFGDSLLQLTKGDGWSKPSKDWFAGTIQTDLLDVLNTTKRDKYMQEFNDNADIIFSKENLNKLEAVYGSKYREAIENMLRRIKTGKNRLESGNRLSNKVLNYINGSIGAIMFFNTRSAILQTISSINFINWSDNNPLKAGSAFANQAQYWKDFKTLMNSDFLVDRRAGLRLNINENEIADLAKTAKNKGKAAISYILRKGYLPTQFADSFAIASGGATFYRNRIKTYLKEGLSQQEAEERAMQDFREIAEESQQSSRPDKISQQQSSDLGRILLAFANTPMQYGRLTKRAYQDLVNGRGDAKSNVSKIIYYTFVQNMIFNVLQQAVFALGFGDDDDEKEEKYYDTANGMADSILRGLGIAGSAVSVGKNFLLDIYERSKRSRPEYVDSVYKLLQFSPPISSKISKIRQAAWMFDSKKRRQEMIDKGLSLDNPAYEAFAKVFTAGTNIPLDRIYLKLDNINAAMAEDSETWQTIALLAGWPEWQIKPSKKPKGKKKKKKSFGSTSKRGGYKGGGFTTKKKGGFVRSK